MCDIDLLIIIIIIISSIIDIEHSPYYIALGSTNNRIVIYWRPTLS